MGSLLRMSRPTREGKFTMHKPESLEDGLLCDLSAIERELRHEPPYEHSGQAARALARTGDLRVMLMVLKAGSHIDQHQASGTATVHVVSGQLKLRVASRDVELHSGQMLILGAGLRHDVSATVDSAFVLTLGRSAAVVPPPS